MSLFKCDLCPRTYRLKKNLKRHIREGHTAIEYWLCVQSGCVSKFVRRSYLSKHLMLKHGFNKLDTHSTACQAPRGDIRPEEYYDDVSDDDTILDLIEEMDKEQFEQHYIFKFRILTTMMLVRAVLIFVMRRWRVIWLIAVFK